MTTTIKDVLVHLDLAPASQGRLEVALGLAETFGAQVTALCLVPEPFRRAMMGVHLPTDLVRDHLAAAEQEAERVLAAADDALRCSCWRQVNSWLACSP
jgi:nucleotide-binding universal stress UspA family protein